MQSSFFTATALSWAARSWPFCIRWTSFAQPGSSSSGVDVFFERAWQEGTVVTHHVDVVDLIPKSLSGETNQDSEPSIAVES